MIERLLKKKVYDIFFLYLTGFYTYCRVCNTLQHHERKKFSLTKRLVKYFSRSSNCICHYSIACKLLSLANQCHCCCCWCRGLEAKHFVIERQARNFIIATCATYYAVKPLSRKRTELLFSSTSLWYKGRIIIIIFFSLSRAQLIKFDQLPTAPFE